MDSQDNENTCTEREGFRNAAIREAKEESGMEIINDLHYFMEFTTPEQKRRFRTAFFISQVESGLPVQVDGSEIVAYQWQSPKYFLKMYQNRELSLMVPTGLTLMRLARYRSAQQVIAELPRENHFVLNPEWHYFADDSKAMVFPGDEHHSTAVGIQGMEHRCIFARKSRHWFYVHNTDPAEYPRLDGGT